MATLAPPAPAAVVEEEAPAESTRKPTRKRTRLVLLLLVVVLLAGAFLERSVLLGSSPKKAAGSHKPEPGVIVQLDAMTLNLADGHFLKLGLALQLTKQASGSAAAPAQGAAAAPAVDGAPAQDAAITVLGERTYAQLLAPGGRTRARQSLQREVATRYGGKVMRVYFTEFVMQ